MISAVITNYKTWDLTLRSLIAINQYPIIKEVIIVDDCSGDNIPEEITKNSVVKLIANATNLGYAKSVNLGVKLATQDYILLLDSDAYPLANINLIEEHFNRDQLLGILALKLVDEQGRETGRFEPEVNEWSLILGQQLYAKFGSFLQNKTGKISVFSCGMAIRKKAFEEVGGFDTSFDFLDADHDFSMRINRSGWTIAVEDQCIIHHVGNGSPQKPSKRVIRFYKNRYKLLAKYSKIKYPKLFIGLIMTRIALELLILRVKYIIEPDDLIKDKIYGRKEIIYFLKNIDE